MYRIIVSLLVFFIYCSGAIAYDSKTIQERIPYQVIEYTNRHFNYLNNSNVHLEQQKDLKDYKVYRIFFDDCRCGLCGPPKYLIYKNDVVRMASSDEVTEIYFANKKKLTEPIPTKSIHDALQLYCKGK